MTFAWWCNQQLATACMTCSFPFFLSLSLCSDRMIILFFLFFLFLRFTLVFSLN